MFQERNFIDTLYKSMDTVQGLTKNVSADRMIEIHRFETYL